MLLRALAQEEAQQATQVETQLRVTVTGLLRGRPGEISQPRRSISRSRGRDLSRKRLPSGTTVIVKAKPEEAEAEC